jgi:hypothetical protein
MTSTYDNATLEATLDAIAHQAASPREKARYGIAMQILTPLLYEAQEIPRGGERTPRTQYQLTENPEIRQNIAQLTGITDLWQWANRVSNRAAIAEDLLARVEKLPAGQCRFIMYTDGGQICFEGEQTITPAMLGRMVASIVESEREHLLPYAHTQGAVAVLASHKPEAETGRASAADTLHMRGYFLTLGGLQQQLAPLDAETVAAFREADIVGAQGLHAQSLQADTGKHQR